MSIAAAQSHSDLGPYPTRFLISGSAGAISEAVARMKSEGWQILSTPAQTQPGIWSMTAARQPRTGHS